MGNEATERATSIPTYTVTTKIDNRVVGDFMAPITDPFVRTEVTVGWCDLLRGLLRRRLVVSVHVSADSQTVTRVLELDPDYLGPAGSASREAWNAALNDRLRSL